MIVYLSRFQKELIIDNQLPVDFYTTETGLEPIIDNSDTKAKLFNKIVGHVLTLMDADAPSDENKEQNKDDENKVIVIKFKNGDRDFLAAATNTIDYHYYKTEKLSDLKDTVYYDKLRNVENPIIGLSFKPNKDELLYYIILSKNKFVKVNTAELSKNNTEDKSKH